MNGKKRDLKSKESQSPTVHDSAITRGPRATGRGGCKLFPLVDAAVIVSGMITASPASRTVSNYARALLIGL